MKKLALYIHIPFCRSKCIYCDFASYPNREKCWPDYLNALRGELLSWQDALKNYEIATVFIGGGTPSILPGSAIAEILQDVREIASIDGAAEITMEANPGTISLEKLKKIRQAGVNRLSFGAQSMDDALLRRLGRIHTAEEVCEAVCLARQAGFDNVSLDLMYALPGQKVEHWLDTLEKAIMLQPDHISAYSLIVEEGTPMYDLAESGRIDLPTDDEVIQMQRAAIDILAEAGYQRYEISNYAKPGKACRHNIVYWDRGDYLGLGCAAHSLMNGERFENPRDLAEYMRGIRRQDRITLTRQDAMEEMLMLSTRMVRGMSLSEYEREFGVNFEKAHASKLGQLEKLGLVERKDGFLRLTRNGLEVQNAVVVELLEE